MKHNGRTVKTFTSGFIVHPSYPFLGCSPHGKVIDKTEDSPYWMLSLKEHALVIVSLEMIDDFPVLKKKNSQILYAGSRPDGNIWGKVV